MHIDVMQVGEVWYVLKNNIRWGMFGTHEEADIYAQKLADNYNTCPSCGSCFVQQITNRGDITWL